MIKPPAYYERECFNKIAPYYDEENKLYMPYRELSNMRTVQELEKIIKTYKMPLVLEIGCGTGYTLATLAPLVKSNCRVIIGIDVSEGMLSIAKSKLQDTFDIQLLIADAMQLPFKEETFDVVSCITTLHHLPYWTSFLKELNRILKEKGCIYIEDRINNKLFDILRKLSVKSQVQVSPYELKEGFNVRQLLLEIEAIFEIEKVEYKEFIGGWIAPKLKSKKLAKLFFIADSWWAKIPGLRRLCMYACLKARKE